MMRLVPLIAYLALAACGDGAADRAQPADSVETVIARAIDNGEWLRPGRWETRTVAVAPDGSEELAGTTNFCLSPEKARRADTRFITGEDTDCAFDSFALVDGRLDGTLTCAFPAGSLAVAMAGPFGPEAYDLTLKIAVPGSPEDNNVTRVTAMRKGECETADGDPAAAPSGGETS